MTDRTVAPHDGDQLMMRVKAQTACAREGRLDLAWDIEKVLRLQRSGEAAGRNLLHVAMTTFKAWEEAESEKVSKATWKSSRVQGWVTNLRKESPGRGRAGGHQGGSRRSPVQETKNNQI